MEGNLENGEGRWERRWRIAAWAGVALVLLTLIGLQLGGVADWGPVDFALAGVLLAGAGIAVELALRMRDNTAYRAAAGVALAAAFVLVWLSVGVGIIGRDGDPANLMYFGVLAVGAIAAAAARFRPAGMARALLAMALAQVLVTLIALAAGLGSPWSGPAELILLNGFFVALFGGAAWLFRKAAREQSPAGTAR